MELVKRLNSDKGRRVWTLAFGHFGCWLPEHPVVCAIVKSLEASGIASLLQSQPRDAVRVPPHTFSIRNGTGDPPILVRRCARGNVPLRGTSPTRLQRPRWVDRSYCLIKPESAVSRSERRASAELHCARNRWQRSTTPARHLSVDRGQRTDFLPIRMRR